MILCVIILQFTGLVTFSINVNALPLMTNAEIIELPNSILFLQQLSLLINNSLLTIAYSIAT